MSLTFALRLRLARLLCPPGYVVAPREPTPEMLRAAARAWSPGLRPTPDWVSNRAKHAHRWRMMLDAAQ